MQVTIDKRVYVMTPKSQALENLKNHLISKGFDGVVYDGVSAPVGKQRKEFRGLFFRSAKTGEFVSAI
jgi:hypothetical protein